MKSVIDNLAERSVLKVLTRRHLAGLAEISSDLAIPSSTAAGAVARLVESEMVFRRDLPSARRGRPSYLYGIRLPHSIASFHLDGSRFVGALFDQEQGVIAQQALRVPVVRSAVEAAAVLAEMLAGLCAEAGQTRPGGVAISINAIRSSRGAHTSSVLPWVDRTIERRMKQALGVEVRLVSPPPHLAAEYRLLEPPMPRSLVYFHAGDGISAHFCLDGEPYAGAAGLTGELGHVTVDPDGLECGCGRRGCLETLVSGPAVAARINAAAQIPGASEWLIQAAAQASPQVAIDHLYRAWQDGKPDAIALAQPMLDRLAWGVGLVLNLLDPERLVAGGYVLGGREPWLDEVAQRARRWAIHGGTRDITLNDAQANEEDLLRVIAAHYRIDSPTKVSQPL